MDLLARSAPHLLLAVAVLALGCAVGEEGSTFSTGLTFGGGASAGPVSGGTAGDSEDDSATTKGNGADSATSNDGGDASPTSNDGPTDGGDSTGSDDGCIPSAEVCNGLDDDCDGVPDNGNPGGDVACNTGMPGVCAEGTSACTAGSLDCVAAAAPSAETCDGLDNDCDGQVDNGNPGGGAACSTGLSGICSAGTQQCSGGALACQQNQAAAPAEVCNNGVDDNCNGQVDEGCCAHPICVTGGPLNAACDPCVATVCSFDPYCCTTAWDNWCVDEVTQYCGIPC